MRNSAVSDEDIVTHRFARGFPASRAVLTALGFEDAGDCEDSEP